MQRMRKEDRGEITKVIIFRFLYNITRAVPNLEQPFCFSFLSVFYCRINVIVKFLCRTFVKIAMTSSVYHAEGDLAVLHRFDKAHRMLFNVYRLIAIAMEYVVVNVRHLGCKMKRGNRDEATQSLRHRVCCTGMLLLWN